jgi:hypothetical protein
MECNQPTILQALKVALGQIRICSRLEGLLLKKKNISNGDSPEVHAQKVQFFFPTGVQENGECNMEVVLSSMKT